MHQALLGVMKQLFQMWFLERRRLFSLTKDQIELLNYRQGLLYGQYPSEFQRRPRSFYLFKRFKATELRQLLLYTLPIILKGILQPFYDHFLKFHCAIRILCSERICIRNNACAKTLLKAFVEHFPDLYGTHNISYNVHSLLHFSEDVENLVVPLDSFSCFKFENYLQFLKKLPKSGFNVNEQLYNRLFELSLLPQTVLAKENKLNNNINGPIHSYFDEYLKVLFELRPPNNFCLLRNTLGHWNICKICKIFMNFGKVYIYGRPLLIEPTSVFTRPLDSKFLHLYVCETAEIEYKDIVLVCCLTDIDTTKEISKMSHFVISNKNYFVRLIH